MKRLVLASASPRRRILLEGAGLKFTIEESGFTEDITQKIPHHALAQKLALGKAETVAVRHRDSVILAADTLIIFNKKVLAKPETAARARAMLRAMSGKTNFAITGVALIDTKSGKKIVFSEETKVHFRKLSPKEIEKYVKTGEPLYVAGGYALQGGAASFADHIEGDFYNIVGLPLAKTIETLKKLGIEAK